MSEIYNKFKRDATIKAADKEHRAKTGYNINQYNHSVIAGKQQFSNLELARQRAGYIKYKAINELEKHLSDFETNFQQNGGKVIWATDARQAVEEIEKILQKIRPSYVVKSKSMISEEIDLNPGLQNLQIEAVETDLGEYIVQLADEKPYHIVTPAMHKSKEDVARLFNEKFQLASNSTPFDIAAFVRGKLRQKFYQAKVGITGANFLLADTGSVCITENEGNGMMSMAFPDVHIVVAGIERILPSIQHLELFWPLLSTFGTGQKVTVYNSIVSGPRQEGEIDGPREMIVILLDNGRSKVLAAKEQRRALSCIKCGACLNACPVFKTIGGHTYNAPYTGPIGAVIMPWMRNFKDYKHLSFASTLCGACTEVCPVNINLHQLLLFNRNHSVEQGNYGFSESTLMYGMRQVLGHRKWMDTPNPGVKNWALKTFFAKSWGKSRLLPEFAERNFKQLWEERVEGKTK
ncbi:MAG TPA: [Fe-S]-binding protein [Bacteroidales bacterium]|nr:[Fe-S]-binding protein [Bacteroidales bacterium]